MNEIKREVEVKIMMDGFNINKAQCIWQVGTHGTLISQLPPWRLYIWLTISVGNNKNIKK